MGWGWLWLWVAVAGASDTTSQSWEAYGRKVAFKCGAEFTLDWDLPSLKQHVAWVRNGQVDPGRWCDEPLRYMWYGCDSQTSKKRIQGIRKIECKGTGAKVGKLSFKGGVVRVEVADEEPKHFERASREFAAALGISLKLKELDTYHDQPWNSLKFQKNPVTDQRNYCLVNGEKEELQDSPYNSMVYRKEDGSAKCWKDGKPYIDVVLEKGKVTGFTTRAGRDENEWIRESFRNDQRDGEFIQRQGDRVINHSFYRGGEEVWERTFHPNGRLERYRHRLGATYAESAEISYNEQGKLMSITCQPKAGELPEFRKLCGFEGRKTVDLFRYNGDRDKTLEFEGGYLVSSADERSGTRGLASTAKFEKGKKHGLEKLTNAKGVLVGEVHWNHGVQDGVSKEFHPEEGKLVRTQWWKKGKLEKEIAFYLNGKPREEIRWEPGDRRHLKEYYDTGGLQAEYGQVMCRRRYWSHWCYDGDFRTFFPTGKPWVQGTFEKGDRTGNWTSYFKGGPLHTKESFEKDQLRALKLYKEDGTLERDETYESDGSLKAKP